MENLNWNSYELMSNEYFQDAEQELLDSKAKAAAMEDIDMEDGFYEEEY